MEWASLEKFAESEWSLVILGIMTFFESVFSPLPPDPLLIAMALLSPNQAILFGVICTIFSVLGALFGYFIGYVFFNEIGFKIFEIYGYEDPNFLKDKFSSKGGFLSWLGILVTAGFTPLPFKLLTISSGFIHFNIFSFIIICVLTRGLRFFLVAYLTFKYGQKIGPLLEKEGTKWAIIISFIIIIIFITFYFLILK